MKILGQWLKYLGEEIIRNENMVPENVKGTGHLCTSCGRFVLEERKVQKDPLASTSVLSSPCAL